MFPHASTTSAPPRTAWVESRFGLAPARSEACIRAAILWVILLLPLLVWPESSQPFSAPKLFAWSLVSFCGVMMSKSVRADLLQPGVRVALLACLAICVSISAGVSSQPDLFSLLLILTALAWFKLLRVLRPDGDRIAAAVVLSGAAVATAALLQYAGVDPFAVFGWVRAGGDSPRMRVYATLGNPNFVAAFLAGTFPLALVFLRQKLAVRWAMFATMLLWLAALAATGSRGGALGLLTGTVVLFALQLRRFRWQYPLMAAAASVLLVAISVARPLPETVEGRLFVWRVSLPRLEEVGWNGFGPGAFEEVFSRWQASYLANPAHLENSRFASRFDHAHNDGLEFLVEYGWAGLAMLAVCAALYARKALRARRSLPLSGAAFAGVLALAAVATVDFPMHRPAELFLLATLMALSLNGNTQTKENNLH